MNGISLRPQDFFQKKYTMGLVGASSSWNDNGYYLFLEMEKKGYKVVPLSLTEKTVCDVPAFPSLLQAEGVDRIIFASADEEVCMNFLKQMRDTAILKAWFEEGFETEEMNKFARDHFLEVVRDINLLDTLRKL